jgi:hypothetical protein
MNVPMVSAASDMTLLIMGVAALTVVVALRALRRKGRE